MTADGRKGLELSWNLLNLADSAAMHGSSLTYAWLSDGTKVAAKADDGSGHGVVKRYLGSFVYTTSGGFSTDVPADVESAAWDEGRIFFDIPEAVPEEYIEDPFSYVFDKGREYHLYDFKHSNNDPSHVGKENALSDTNRGMPIGQNKSGTTVFASARDIGNIGAGIVAKNARTGLLVARLGFDGYQTIQKIKNGGKLRWSIEGKTTRSAQMYGLSRSGKIKRDIQRYEKSH